MMRRGSWLVLIAVVAMGTTVAVAKGKKKKAGKPLLVPASKVKAASWPSPAPDAPPRFSLVAFDAAMALGASAAAPGVLLAHTDGGGVVGPIALPKKTAWIGTGQGAIYAATDDGTLHRADTLAAARKDGLTKVQRIKGATQWDAGGGAVIVAAGRRVSVSTDGGASFVDHDFASDVVRVFARGDGVVVAVPDGSWAWVSKDAGKSWKAPPAGLDPAQQTQPDCQDSVPSWGDDGDVVAHDTCLRPIAPAFVRDGDLIVAYGSSWNNGSGTEFNCVQGALAVDGKTWVAPGEQPRYDHRPTTPFDTLQRMDGATVPVTAAPAAKGTSAVDATKACLANPEGLADRSGVGMGGGDGECHGLGCLALASPPPDDGTHAFFTDAVCDYQTWTCTRPATRLSIGRKGEVVLSRAPCAPGWMTSREGTAVLECTTPTRTTTEIFLGDRAGGWHPQDDLPIGDGVRIDVGDDGTVLAAAPCSGKPCSAFVRAPATLETRASWLEVTQAGAQAYRVVPGGRALAVLPASTPRADALQIHVGGYGASTVVDGSYYDAWTTSYYDPHPLQPILETCLQAVVERLGPRTGTLAVTAEVDARGKLTGLKVTDPPDPASGDCIAAAARTLTYRKPGQAVVSTRTVGYEAADLRYSLWLLGGAKPVRLADDLDASGGLRDVRVVGTQIEVTTGARAYDARTGVLARDGRVIPQK